MTSKATDVSERARELLAAELSNALGRALLSGHPCGHHTMNITTALRAVEAALSPPLPSLEGERLRNRVQLLLDWDFGDESNHCIALAEASAALLSALPPLEDRRE